jgi:hypothetical protein
MSDEAVQVDETTAGAVPATGTGTGPDTEDLLEALRDVVDPSLASTWWTWAWSTASPEDGREQLRALGFNV